MERVDDTEVDSLMRIIQDRHKNPTSAERARTIGEKWLKENDFGMLEMSKKSRETLEKALAETRSSRSSHGSGFF